MVPAVLVAAALYYLVHSCAADWLARRLCGGKQNRLLRGGRFVGS
jgi:hypothetical protein